VWDRVRPLLRKVNVGPWKNGGVHHICDNEVLDPEAGYPAPLLRMQAGRSKDRRVSALLPAGSRPVESSTNRLINLRNRKEVAMIAAAIDVINAGRCFADLGRPRAGVLLDTHGQEGNGREYSLSALSRSL